MYASIATHLGVEQSRRDDLESLSYVIIYFLEGSLPWQNAIGKTKKEIYMKMLEKKLELTENEIYKALPGKNLIIYLLGEIIKFVAYVRNLKFDEKPDYIYLKTLLKEIEMKNNISLDNIYDWNVIKNAKK